MGRGKDEAVVRIFHTGSGRALRRIERDVPLWERHILDRLVEGLIDIPVFLTDARGKITTQSPALEMMLGYSSAETIGRSASEFIVGGKTVAQAILKKLLKHGQVIRHKVQMKAKDGQSMRCALTAKVVKDTGGRVAGMVGSLHNIDSTGDIGKDFDSEGAPSVAWGQRREKAIVWLDIRNRIIRLDKAAQRIFGYSEHEVAGRGLSMILPDRRTRFWVSREIRKRADDRGAIRDFEISTVDRNGRTLRLNTNWTPLHDDAGRIIGEEIAIEELTEPSSFQFRQINPGTRMTAGLVAARIAHEVKNPLGSLYLNVEMLGSYIKVIADEELRKEALGIVESVMSAIGRLESIAREFLICAGATRMRVRRQSISEMLFELQRFMKEEMASRNIEFINEFSEHLPEIDFDRDRMKDAILNLYENAADAMPDGGKVKSFLRLSGGCIEIRISDTGSGVSDEDIERLFEPFFTTKEAGTGLGLSIVEGTMMAHGGTVECLRHSSDGAVFLIKLPLDH